MKIAFISGIVSEVGLREIFVQSQPLADLVADMDCSSLPALLDFD